MAVGERPAAGDEFSGWAEADGFELPAAADELEVADQLAVGIAHLADAGVGAGIGDNGVKSERRSHGVDVGAMQET